MMDETSKIAQMKLWRAVLANHPLFLSLNSTEQEELCSLMTPKSYSIGDAIVIKDNAVDTIHFILSGTAEVQEKAITGETTYMRPIATLQPGDTIGLNETGFFSTTGVRTATVVATTLMSTLCLELTALKQFLNRHPHTHQTMLDQTDVFLRMHFLKETVPFASLDISQLRYFAEQIDEITLPAGTVLFKHGDMGEHAYFIRSGKIEITYQDTKGDSRFLAELESPSLLGESALLFECPRSTTAKITENSTLLVLSKKVFQEMLNIHSIAAPVMELHRLRSRPCKHPNIEVFRNTTQGGEVIITLRDLNRNKYFRMPEEGLFVWEKLDGHHTIHDITMDFWDEYDIFNPQEIATFITQLIQAGFIETDSKERETKPKNLPLWLKLVVKINQLMTARIIFPHVDEFLTWSFDKGIWILFTKSAQYFMTFINIIGLFSFIYYFHTNAVQLNMATNKPLLLYFAVITLMFTFVLHELAHAYTTKFYNRRVYAFGVGWFWLGPVAFCDTSDMWLSDQRSRIIVDGAGLYLNAFLAGLAGTGLWFSTSTTVSIFLWLFSLYSYLLIFTNLNPLIELDGYYLYIDIFNKPNLRETAIKWLLDVIHQPSHLILDSIKQNKIEFYYWVSCFIYLLTSVILAYIVASYLLFGIFNIYHPGYTLFITLFIFILSSIRVWGKIKHCI